MAKATWSWSGTRSNVNEKLGFTLTGSGIPEDAIIRRVSYEIDLQANKYSSSWYWELNYIQVENGPSMETIIRQDMSGIADTIYCEDVVDTTLYDAYKSDTLEVLVYVRWSRKETSNVKGLRIIVDYDVPGVVVGEFSVNQKGSKYIFSWNANVIAVEGVKYDLYKNLENGDSERVLGTLTGDNVSSAVSKIPRSDYGNPISFFLVVSWEYKSNTHTVSASSNQITPEFRPIYVRYYKDGVGYDCLVTCYDEKKKEWVECEVNYYDGENWIECSTI